MGLNSCFVLHQLIAGFPGNLICSTFVSLLQQLITCNTLINFCTTSLFFFCLFVCFCRSFRVTRSGCQRLRRNICTLGRRRTRRTRPASTWTQWGRERGCMWKKKLWSTLRSREPSAEISSCVCLPSLLTQLSAGGVFYMQQMQNFIWTLFFDTVFPTCFVCGLCFNKLKLSQLLYRENSLFIEIK